MKELEQAEDDFAHKALVEAIENQIAEGHPREAGLVMMALTSKGMDHEEALTAMADVLASHIARSDETGTGFDVNAYAAGLLALS
ncbi:MAG: hypothetical protein CL537_12320 [Alcanivoracaceae bacterium]|nr:hypothetical protein [Alcanivoracaceae bacterium]MCG8438535.1 DUF1841 family protein [Pseudomonadales bacterium]MEE2870678.1 hypothetical protein [Pseudomonadota bacterium]|tara:strand:+ start:1994 stop:2248 length:255 start_codon:yes stop_codon:yes gene_type:complete